VSQPLLQVENLRTYLDSASGLARAVDGVSFTVNKGETLAVVGESGCGKSMTALSIMQLVPEPAGYVESGRILFEGRDLLDMTWDQMRTVRGKDIAMIFQEPMTSLNAVFTVGWQLTEAMKIHGKGSSEAARRGPATAGDAEAWRRGIELLGLVGMPEPAQHMRQYPHELSGGMRQRVMIAMALANDPKLLIADEPTTALDVTIQAQILDLMRSLQKRLGMAILLITHDLGVVARMADEVAVMYAGQIVERASASALFADPQHPYTQGLFASLPTRARRGQDLTTLEGIVPQSTKWPAACRFEPRCHYKFGSCATIAPKERPAGTDRPCRCHLYDPDISDRPAIRADRMPAITLRERETVKI